MSEFLNDAEKVELTKFYENKILFQAVKKVLLSGVYFDGILVPGEPSDPLRNFVLARFTNQQGMMPPLKDSRSKQEMGEELSILINAVSLIETGFNKFAEYKKVEAVETKKKSGR